MSFHSILGGSSNWYGAPAGPGLLESIIQNAFTSQALSRCMSNCLYIRNRCTYSCTLGIQNSTYKYTFNVFSYDPRKSQHNCTPNTQRDKMDDKNKPNAVKYLCLESNQVDFLSITKVDLFQIDKSYVFTWSQSKNTHIKVHIACAPHVAFNSTFDFLGVIGRHL